MVEKMEVSAPSASTGAGDLPWVEKYRPSTLDDLIAHEDIISICKYIMVNHEE